MKTPEPEERLLQIVRNLPEGPGCYQYLNDEGTIIYVGKAKNLKRRVSSYFNREHDSLKTRMLVSKIRDIKYVVVKREEDALLLENNLIKRYQPRYNVLLKDGKTYPSICVTGEPYPRVFKTRSIQRGSGTYYGPYSHIPTMQALLDVIRALYHPRTCRLPLQPEEVKRGKYKECLDYHLGLCGAPCTGRESQEEYLSHISECRRLLRGEVREVKERLLQEMRNAAAELRFEEAQALKEKAAKLERFRAGSEVVSAHLGDMDVFCIEKDGDVAFVNWMHVHEGAVNQAFTFEYRMRMGESESELLSMAIGEMRSRYNSLSREIVVPFMPDWELEGVRFTVPERGEKRKLLELSSLNVKQYRFDRLKRAEKLNPEQRATRLMKEIQAQLSLEKLPLRVEMFDNSHMQGSDAVAACVVFERLKPSKKDYHLYNIRLSSGKDDYASMREVSLRRYGRMKDEGSPLPDLILADGGKGQMEALRETIEGELGLSIPIAGLVKDGRHRTRELLFGTPPQTVGLKVGSELFKLLERMQDEVHRFAIGSHRRKRSKRMTSSELDNVKGLGEKSRAVLFKAFGSVERMREAPLAMLQTTAGNARGALLYRYLHSEDGEKGENE